MPEEQHITLASGDAVTNGTRPPAYFLSLSLENVRCFGSKQTLSLEHDGKPAMWTVILGENGIGKTTILESFAQMELTIPHWVDPPYTAIPEGFIYGYKRKLLRLQSPSAQIACTIQTPNIPRATYSLEPRIGGSGATPLTIKANLENEQETFLNKSLVPTLNIFGYGPSRYASQDIGEMGIDSSSVGQTLTLFNGAKKLINNEEWLANIDHSIARSSGKEKQQKQEQFNEIKATLIDLLPNVQAIDVGFDEDDSDNPRVRFQTADGWVSLKQLSHGYQAMMAWVLDFVYRMYKKFPKSKNPLQEAAVVLVDEIDLHLHPAWQRKIKSYLRGHFPNTQFIVTAHSPLIVQASADENIVVLKRVGDEVHILQNPVDVRGWRTDQILRSEMFGLPIDRASDVQQHYERQRELTHLTNRTEAEEQELREVNALIDALPFADTPDGIEAARIIRETAAMLKQQAQQSALAP
jgi:predicted ATP-binding protein involved in virulence